ncbi:MAG: aquaporin family protein [Acidobacteriota bacterium]|nr:aquaporin family protein [Acidobacteriota bacterium]
MTSPLLGEFLGTLILILLGDGVVAAVVLKHSKAHDSGWIVITAGWAFAVMAGVFTAMACGGEGHLNPAVTLGLAVYTGSYSKVIPYFIAQLLGAMFGAALVWLQYLQHWRETENPAAKLACFCTHPAIRSFFPNLLSETIATFVLVFVARAIGKGVVADGFAPGIQVALIASLVWGIGLSLGGPTGYAINPARDLGPRIAHAILPIAGKGQPDWPYAPVPIIGPLLGGALAGLSLRLLNI